MITVTFIRHDGSREEVRTSKGKSLMQAAMDHGIEEIIADCGGACSCATCHCYIADTEKLAGCDIDDLESAMLEHVLDPTPHSRLSCQIIVSEQMDGLEVSLPESQY